LKMSFLNINQRQQAFEGARGQFERLSDLPVGTVDEQLQRQLEDELANLERQATEGQGRISQIERERGAIESIGTEGGRSLSDEELLGYLETGDLPGGLRGGRPEGEGTAPEGGLGEGGEGEGDGEGGEGEGRRCWWRGRGWRREVRTKLRLQHRCRQPLFLVNHCLLDQKRHLLQVE
jgi:hypothetical protein